MPRRKGGKGKAAGASKPKRNLKSNASVKRWNTRDEIPLDEVDQFHSNKDKILVDGSVDDDMDDGDDDEVFGLQGVDEDEDDADDTVYDDEDEDEDIGIPEEPKKKGRAKKKAKKEVSSDEEEEEEEEETWGRGKAVYYNSNADQLESDDEEGHELEEQEAKRLQTKSREHMHDEDFGLKDAIEAQKDDDLIEEPTVAPAQILPTEPKEIVRYLEKTNAEVLALARDWEDTAEQLIHVQKKLKDYEAENPESMGLGMIHLHYQTLLSYSAVLAYYLHLRATPKYAQKPLLLQAHPIMNRLLTLKQALMTMEDLNFTMSEDELDDFSDDEEDDEEDTGELLWDHVKKLGLDEDELADLLKDADEDMLDERSELPRTKRKKEKKEPPKKKRKVQDEHSEFDLVEPEYVSSKKTSSRRNGDTDDSFGEAQFMQQGDIADKAARKKSLQFHTSRIESASARRQSARSQAVGGDDDIPYRERQREKQARLEKAAADRVAKQGGADLDDVDPEPPSRKRALDDDGSDDSGGESPGGYYELVKKKSKQRKEKKKEDYDAARAAERIVPDAEDASGPRSLTRAILKNKGLTPHRSKDVRNPRVKKRKKYEQAKKKLSSQKAMFKGGLSETGGHYGGEKSGITKVIKSVRL
ncbi:hypothetical protein FA15DRAFT_665796 [Coprinopsis marcescibilis]|uniref:Sas10 C-terminal domain-containing protein n=1 Tax=Coprinopsis marcescibilis TaxID=230819 RepID=A0A5C3L5F3_COPMA|nr:hypothetical protein FA15DRAFT_665796 [Coprinopsis marcescibilis]